MSVSRTFRLAALSLTATLGLLAVGVPQVASASASPPSASASARVVSPDGTAVEPERLHPVRRPSARLDDERREGQRQGPRRLQRRRPEDVLLRAAVGDAVVGLGSDRHQPALQPALVEVRKSHGQRLVQEQHGARDRQRLRDRSRRPVVLRVDRQQQRQEPVQPVMAFPVRRVGRHDRLRVHGRRVRSTAPTGTSPKTTNGRQPRLTTRPPPGADGDSTDGTEDRRRRPSRRCPSGYPGGSAVRARPVSRPSHPLDDLYVGYELGSTILLPCPSDWGTDHEPAAERSVTCRHPRSCRIGSS